MRFGIVNRTVSYIGLRQISGDVTLLAKAPLGKGPRPPPASWKAQASTKKDLDREIKNRHVKPEEKRQKITKYIVAVCALGAITFISQPFWAPSAGRVSESLTSKLTLILFSRLLVILEW